MALATCSRSRFACDASIRSKIEPNDNAADVIIAATPVSFICQLLGSSLGILQAYKVLHKYGNSMCSHQANEKGSAGHKQRFVLQGACMWQHRGKSAHTPEFADVLKARTNCEQLSSSSHYNMHDDNLIACQGLMTITLMSLIH